jgi:DNA-nicking Smr family endonuclease
MAIDGRLDLHGLTQAEAHDRLSGFVKAAQARGKRVLLVITGKGYKAPNSQHGGESGVLRRAVPRWLNAPDLRPLVLAIHAAQPRHGGEGALYVLLKRNRVP